jgi:hypothetical protein
MAGAAQPLADRRRPLPSSPERATGVERNLTARTARLASLPSRSPRFQMNVLNSQFQQSPSQLPIHHMAPLDPTDRSRP